MEPLILLEKVALYRDDQLILNDVNFQVNKSDFVYIIGKVGEGKTTLINSLMAEVPIKQGKAHVVGYDLLNIKSKNIPMLRRKIGVVFQDFQLLSDRTVDDNLRFVLAATGWKNEKSIKERIDMVLEQTGMQNKGYKMPHQLSGGEQQRIVISRALLNDPLIILADEPTGHLDPDTSCSIMEILLNLKNKGTAVVMATHNYNLLKQYPNPTYRCEKNKFSQISNNNETEIDLSEL